MAAERGALAHTLHNLSQEYFVDFHAISQMFAPANISQATVCVGYM